MNPEIEWARDDEQPAWFEDAEDLVERPAHLEDVLEGFDAENRARGRVWQADGRNVLDAIDTRPASHVAADVSLARKHPAQVGIALLPFNLKRAELVHRGRTVKSLGHKAAKRLVVVSHGRCSSLSRTAGLRKNAVEWRKSSVDEANLRTIAGNGQAEPSHGENEEG